MIDPLYVVTDIEVDGPDCGQNSMIAFASVAVTAAGATCGEFEAVLAPLPGAAPDAATMAWFKGYPEAYIGATEDPQPPLEVMTRYVRWVRGLPSEAMFTAHPLAFDGAWIDFYLRRFAGLRLAKGPWAGERLFISSGLCLRSFAAGVLGWPLEDCDKERYPLAWLGGHEHSHRAIDDARGYASLLVYLMSRRRRQDPT